MNQKHVGFALILFGITTGLLGYVIKVQQDELISHRVSEIGSCMLDDGTCLHGDRNWTAVLVAGFLSASSILFGIYLAFIDRTQESLAQHQVTVTEALRGAKEEERKKDEFKAFLAGFSPDEKKVLLAVRDQDGILQSTLKYRTGIGKAKLSLILADLEKKEVVHRKEKGKTKQVFLRDSY